MGPTLAVHLRIGRAAGAPPAGLHRLEAPPARNGPRRTPSASVASESGRRLEEDRSQCGDPHWDALRRLRSALIATSGNLLPGCSRSRERQKDGVWDWDLSGRSPFLQGGCSDSPEGGHG